jgi:hypothetical protein
MDAAHVLACAVVEVGGLRLEALGERPVAEAGGAVASGAVLGEERCGASELGCAPRADRDAIGGDHLPPQVARGLRHRGGRGLAGDELAQRGAVFQEARLGRVGRERCEPRTHVGRELGHLVVFVGALHLAVGDGRAVVDRDVVEQVHDHRRVLRMGERCEEHQEGSRGQRREARCAAHAAIIPGG